MCITCGCGDTDEHDGTGPSADCLHWHQHADGTWHSHDHEHDREHQQTHEHEHQRESSHCHEQDRGHALAGDPDRDPAMRASAGGARLVRVERDLLAKNDAIAARIRARIARAGSVALNFVSSPGAGKTTLLCRTIEALGPACPVVVIEGDQQTSLDADRIRATGAPALQINTGKGCHLDAAMVERALARLDPAEAALVLVENVGNLVCPAAFDLGEDAKVVVLSVTEGDDKPLKYPDMFAAAQLMLINKVDLLEHCDFGIARALEHARRVNRSIEMIPVSARDGRGLDAWIAWIGARRAAKAACAAYGQGGAGKQGTVPAP